MIEQFLRDIRSRYGNYRALNTACASAVFLWLIFKAYLFHDLPLYDLGASVILIVLLVALYEHKKVRLPEIARPFFVDASEVARAFAAAGLNPYSYSSDRAAIAGFLRALSPKRAFELERDEQPVYLYSGRMRDAGADRLSFGKQRDCAGHLLFTDRRLVFLNRTFMGLEPGEMDYNEMTRFEFPNILGLFEDYFAISTVFKRRQALSAGYMEDSINVVRALSALLLSKQEKESIDAT